MGRNEGLQTALDLLCSKALTAQSFLCCVELLWCLEVPAAPVALGDALLGFLGAHIS